jgi:hypothetical protein
MKLNNMGFLDFIKRNITSINRNLQKIQVINSITEAKHLNNGVINLHRIDENNAGDFFCAPHHYFKALHGTQVDIYDYKSSNPQVVKDWSEKIINNALVIGGGGLLNRGSFEKQIKLFESLSGKGKKTVLWGVGHNSKDKSEFGKIASYNIDVNNFGLVGTRDFNMPGEFVPCVSCMHPIFDKTFEETQDIGIIYHKKTLKNKQLIKKLNEFPSTSNTKDIDEIVSFIGKSNQIVTDSYHAMYWSMLLGKKVVVVPNSSKFYDFKYQPIITSFENFETDLKKSTAYSGILNEFRDINLKFADKVFDYLNL